MGGIVEAAQQNGFVRHLSTGLFEEIVGGFHDRVDAGLFVGGNNARAQPIVGRVQRNRQVILFFQIGQAADLDRQADRRNRNVAGADAQSVFVAGNGESLEQILKI